LIAHASGRRGAVLVFDNHGKGYFLSAILGGYRYKTRNGTSNDEIDEEAPQGVVVNASWDEESKRGGVVPARQPLAPIAWISVETVRRAFSRMKPAGPNASANGKISSKSTGGLKGRMEEL
jgi:hypothetical protein